MLAYWSIPFPRNRDRKKKRCQQQKQGSGRRSREVGPQQPPPPPRPGWDSTTSDHSRYKLSEAEMEFRRSLRQSRHRLHAAGTSSAALYGQDTTDCQEQILELEVALAQGLLEEHQGPGHVGPVHEPPAGATSWLRAEQSDVEDAAAESLDGMRQFLAMLQQKYGLGGSDTVAEQAAAATRSVGGACTLAERKLAQLRAQQRAASAVTAAEQDEGDSDSGDSNGCELGDKEGEQAGQTRNTAATVAPASAAAPACSDSEGEGHLGPAALRRVQRRLTAAAAAAAAGATAARAAGEARGTRSPCKRHQPGHHPAEVTLSSQPLPAQHSILDRLAAAEAKLERLAGLEGELQQTRAAVTEVQERNVQLQTELDACISHSLRTTTQLQAQISRLLASGSTGGDAAPPSSEATWAKSQQPESPVAQLPAVSVAVLQARAAAEALAVAQQAQAQVQAARQPATDTSPPAAHKAGQQLHPPSACLPLQQQRSMGHSDALADVQLPSFRRFAELRRAAASKPVDGALQHSSAHAGGAATAWTNNDSSTRWRTGATQGENSPPQPRSLPQSLLQPCRGTAAAAGAQPNGLTVNIVTTSERS